MKIKNRPGAANTGAVIDAQTYHVDETRHLCEPGTNHSREGRGLSPKSVKNHLSLISAVFSYAAKMGMVQNNPCRAVTLPPLETGKDLLYPGGGPGVP